MGQTAGHRRPARGRPGRAGLGGLRRPGRRPVHRRVGPVLRRGGISRGRRRAARSRPPSRSSVGVVARLDAAQLAAVEAAGLHVTEDSPMSVAGNDFAVPTADHQLAAVNPGGDWDLDAGAGVGVALVDTGVTEVADLRGRVVHGPEPERRAGRPGHLRPRHVHGRPHRRRRRAVDSRPTSRHVGVAPGAHIVSVKVAGADGGTNLSKVLQGIGWVVAHGDEHAVRVLNLSSPSRPSPRATSPTRCRRPSKRRGPRGSPSWPHRATTARRSPPPGATRGSSPSAPSTPAPSSARTTTSSPPGPDGATTRLGSQARGAGSRRLGRVPAGARVGRGRRRTPARSWTRATWSARAPRWRRP